MFLTSDGWISEYRQKGALWIHDDNPRRPHALLTSDLHSNGFFNSRLVIADEPLLREAASDLVDLLVQIGGDENSPDSVLGKVDRVVGPQTGATKLAEFIADEIEERRGRTCRFASPAKAGEGIGKKMIFYELDSTVEDEEIVLLCEDVLTTGGSVDLTSAAVTEAGGTILPFVLLLVNRSGLSEVSGKKLLPLIDRPMPIWTPEACPLCKAGSEAIRPKGENWARLNAIY